MNTNCPYLEKKCEDIGCDCAKYLAYLDAQDPEKVAAIMEKYNFNINTPAWTLLMTMQKTFESRFHDMTILTKDEMEHWLDRYCVCIEDEIREVREHLNLYNNDDITNVNDIELKKEVIDILHFVMDLYLSVLAEPNKIKSIYEQYYKMAANTDLIFDAYNFQKNNINDYLCTYNDSKKIIILKAACKLSDALGLVRQQISWKHWKKPNASINFSKVYEAFAIVFHEFINLTILTMNVDEIKDIYVSKNIENIFRQEHNY